MKILIADTITPSSKDVLNDNQTDANKSRPLPSVPKIKYGTDL